MKIINKREISVSNHAKSKQTAKLEGSDIKKTKKRTKKIPRPIELPGQSLTVESSEIVENIVEQEDILSPEKSQEFSSK